MVPILRQTALRFGQISDASITIHADDSPFEVVTDRFMIGIILSNLLDNAIKYSHDQPTIMMGVTRTRAGQSWQLNVSDKGMGIPRQSLPIFLINITVSRPEIYMK